MGSPLRGGRAEGAESVRTPPPPVQLSLAIPDATGTTYALNVTRLVPHRFGVIDLGSNSVRILVVDAPDPGRRSTIVQDRELIRLGQGLSAGSRLSAPARSRALAAVQRFAHLARAAGAASITVFATAAVRDAANGAAFAKVLARASGVPVRILSDREEGLVARIGIARDWDLREGHHAIADLGGGSLEVVRSFNDLILSNDSLPLGALRLTEQFGGPVAASGKRFTTLVTFVRQTLAPISRRVHSPPRRLVGSGGGFTVAAAILGRRERTRPVTLRDLSSLIASLRSLTLEARIRSTGLEPERAEILVPALAVVRELMRTLGVTECNAHEGALRQGLVELVSAPPRTPAPSCVEIARELLRSMPAEQTHSEHVRHLCCELFDSLRAHDASIARCLTDHHRDLLQAGALTHDLGIAVHEASHHIESESIVRETPRPWTDADRDVVAAMCRFHRKNPPEETSPSILALDRASRRPAMLLIALLRSADALDRTHACRVARARLERVSRAHWRLHLKCRGPVQPELKAWWRKGAMLRDLLGARVTTVVA